jgi:hypothetical protein
MLVGVITSTLSSYPPEVRHGVAANMFKRCFTNWKKKVALQFGPIHLIIGSSMEMSTSMNQSTSEKKTSTGGKFIWPGPGLNCSWFNLLFSIYFAGQSPTSDHDLPKNCLPN